ncbi:hypothetical protein ACFQ07_30240 [Actinomadura adrarensis]|uniref:DUF4351 domain-containing protein n=1 Tax=Actinomadura adrarensis TaxID=1819600 RepID=A0ABW3CQ86_9ACTN
MPTQEHEVPLHMIRQRPRLAVDILRRVTGVPLPDHDQVVSASENVSTLKPAEMVCDGTVLADKDGNNVLGIVVESQRQKDPAKFWRWPAYVATFRAEHQCDVELLVFCRTSQAARALGEPIILGPTGSCVRPVAFAPEDLPPITDPDEAIRHPELAILTTPAHVESPVGRDVARAYAAAISVLPADNAQLYDDYVRSLLSPHAQQMLEEIVPIEGYQWQSDFTLRNIAKGEIRGEAKAILRVLRSQKVCVPDEARDRIMNCSDQEQLERWLDRVATVTTVDELFD